MFRLSVEICLGSNFIICVHFFKMWFVFLLKWHLLPYAAAEDHCAAMDDPSVQHFDVRIPLLPVPETRTTYVCQVIKIPMAVDQDFHAVAFQPLIETHGVMHHMILFSCDGHNDMPEEFTKAHQCGSADNKCRTWMAQWSLGVDGMSCPHPDTGVRFGKSVGSHLMLQIHWNNADLSSGLTDNSGMRVFYTSKLRQFDLGHVQVGQQNLVIPAGVTRHAQTGGCTGECTNMLLPHPIYLTTSHLHMHYLGAGGWLEVVHSDGNITQVTHDDIYDFEHPPVHHLTSVMVLPGDYLRVTCLFSSKDGTQQRNRTVYFGEGSDGEMCYAFVAYYPKIQGFDQCLQLDKYDINCPTESNSLYRECSGPFLSTMESQYIPDVVSACNKTEEELCRDGCKQSLDAVNSHPCLQGALGDHLERELLPLQPAWKDMEDARVKFTSLCGALSIM